MLSFNYLYTRPSLRDMLSRYRLPSHLRMWVFITIWLWVFVVAVWGVEIARLHKMIQAEHLDELRYTDQLRILRKAKIYAARVAAISALDEKVRRIAGSGTTAARTLARIAHALPSDVWITSVSPDVNGTAIEGRTGSFSALERTLLHILRDPTLGQPALESAQVADDTGGPLSLRFSLHISTDMR